MRYLDLVKNPRQPIGSATNGQVFNLKELVELTSLGREWAKQIDNMDRSANAPEVRTSGEVPESRRRQPRVRALSMSGRAPADQGLFFGVALVVGAVMSSAFDAENWVRRP